MKKILFTVCLISGFHFFAQKEETTSLNSANYFQFDYFLGNILSQDAVKHLITARPKGFLLSYNKRSFGDQLWAQHFNYPDIGFTLGYQNFKNKSLGELYAAYAHYNFYLLNRQSKNKLTLGLGFGFGLITNPYNKVNNNKNVLIGSHLNTSSFLKLFYQRENLIQNIGLQVGFTFLHASNASFKAPNKGINTYGFNLGLNYNLSPEKHFFIKSIDSKNYREPVRFNLALATGANESDFIGTGIYPFLVVSLFADKRLNRKSALQFGTELHLHTYLKDYVKFKSIFNGDVAKTNFDDWKRISVFFGYELFINKLSIYTQVGYYLYSPEIIAETLYERIGVKTYFNDSFFASLGLKVHLVNAEGLEFGIGYRF